MTNEEMQKTMEFILEHQAQFAVNIQRLQEERVRDQPRLARLEESFRLVVQLAQTADSRLDTFESNTGMRLEMLEQDRDRDRPRLTRLEESFQLLVQLAQTTDTRVDALEFNRVTLESNMAALAVAQAHSEKKLTALIEIVREGRNGKS